MSALLKALSSELTALASASTPGVVGIESRRGGGTGVVLSPDGLVLTNAHVVRAASGRIRARFSDGRSPEARVVGVDDRTDLAVLKVDPEGALAPLSLGRSSELAVGQLVLAVGHPLRFERSVALGVVSALDRSLPGPGGGLEGLIQTDAAINPGNSGGPLLDADGAVVGINTAIVPFAQGLGFAVASDTASWVVSVLVRDGEVRRPTLGIAARSEELPRALATTVGQARALRVHGVEDGSPAGRADLRKGDLLLRADERTVKSVDDLQRVMVLKAGGALTLSLYRGEAALDREVRPGPPVKKAA